MPADAKVILEVGCGAGGFSSQFMKEGVEVWGIEPFKEVADQAKSKLTKVICDYVENAISQLPDNYFDAIIFNDVLEHLIHPGQVINDLKVKLSKEGCIVASIPNVRYVKNLHHVLVGRDWKYVDSGILDYTHYRFFTKKSIRRMFDESGYNLDKLQGIRPTKVERFRLFNMYLSLVLMTNQSDARYPQFAVVARPIKA